MMKTFLTIFILLVFSLVNYDISGQNKSSSVFKDATLILDQKTTSPKVSEIGIRVRKRIGIGH